MRLPRSAAFVLSALLWLVWLHSQLTFARSGASAVSALDLLILTDIAGLSLSPDGNWAVFQLRRANPAANRYAMGWYAVSTRGRPMPRYLANAGDPMLAPTGAIACPPPVWSPDGRSIGYLRQDQGKVELWRVALEGGNAKQLTRTAGDPRHAIFSPDGGKILFDTARSRREMAMALQREGRGGYLFDRRFNPIAGSQPADEGDVSAPVRVFDLMTRSERPATEAESAQFAQLTASPTITSASSQFQSHVPGTLICADDAACGLAHGRFVALYEEAAAPRRLVAIDSNTGAIQTLYDPNPTFPRLTEPRRIHTRLPSGRETSGYLVLPANGSGREHFPLVIVTYRCAGFLRGGVGDEYPIFPLASQGFAVLCQDVADVDLGHLPQNWQSIEVWARGPGQPEKHQVQEGLDAAVSQLDTAGIIDRDRVGLTGLSFGAETVSFALFHMRHLAAAIASYADLNPTLYYLTDEAGRVRLRRWGLGPLETTPTRWHELALSLNVDRVRAPLLLNVSDREYLTSLEPVIALQEAGRVVEMYVFPDEYHNKWQPAHRLAIYERNIDWLKFWLQGREDPRPEKARQFSRWRQFRQSSANPIER